MKRKYKFLSCITGISVAILGFYNISYAQLLMGGDAFYEFRINPYSDIKYFLDTSSTSKYTAHTDAYNNAISKFDNIDGTNISFKQVNNKEDALIEFGSVNSPKEEWVGIAKIAYNEFTKPVPKVTGSSVFLNEYNIVTSNLNNNHIFEIALHELGHTFGLIHQNQSYDNDTIMAPYIIQRKEGRTDLTTADKQNIISAYPTIYDWKNHWAKETIKIFLDKGYVSGYGEGIVKPDNPVTRAEFVTILNNVFGLTESSNKVFSDTTTHWAKESIDIAVTKGICQGKSSTMFDPNGHITREEAAVMVANYKQLSDWDLDKLSTYKDAYKVSTWAKNYVEATIENGYMNGYSDGTYKPKGKLTRAEAMVILNRIDK